MVECCPMADQPMIVPNQKTSMQRKALYAIIYGEVGAGIGRAYIFGFLTGALHMVTIWIDYMGYATMHYCQVTVISICGAIEAVMLLLNACDGGPLEAAVK